MAIEQVKVIGRREGRAGRGNNSKCDADDLGILSSRYLAAPRQSERLCCLFGWPPTSLFCPFKCPQELQFTFPCSRTFHNMLVFSASWNSPCLCCWVCACSEVVHLLLTNPIPCLLSMHSERVFLFFFPRFPSVAVISTGSVFFFFFSPPFLQQKCLVTNTHTSNFFFLQEYILVYHFAFWRFGVLDKDATVSVEFQDLPKSLLGCGHSFLRPFAWKRIKKEEKHEN